MAICAALLAIAWCLAATHAQQPPQRVLVASDAFDVASALTDAAVDRGALIADRASRLQRAIQFPTVSASSQHSSTCGCSHQGPALHGHGDHVAKNNATAEGDPSNDDLPSETRQALAQMRDWLREAFPLVHQHLELEVVAEYSLLYTWRGTDASLEPAMLCAHMDVVPISTHTESQWLHGPFDGVIDQDGFLYGRGTLDFKNGVIGTMEAVETLLRQSGGAVRPKRTLIMAYGHDEEIMGVRGAREIARVLRERQVRPQFILDEGTPIIRNGIPTVAEDIALIGIAEKGFLNMRMRIHSLGGHSSMTPPNGTIISRLVDALHALQNNPLPARYGSSPAAMMLEQVAPYSTSPVVRFVLSNGWLFDTVPFLLDLALYASPSLVNFFVTTQAVTMLNGGEAPNVNPNEATAIINYRIASGSSVAEVQQHVIRVLARAGLMDPERPYYDASTYIGGHIVIDKAVGDGSDGMVSGVDPSQLSPAHGPGYDAIAAAIKTLHPDAIVAPSLMIAGTDTKHYADLTGAVYRFSPLVLNVTDTARIHGVNERIGVEAYSRYVDYFVVLIANACELVVV